ncbi:hypothetical protein HK096_002871 [Nowakowskiella sp. JEL0078]|nr:hypothetical protein HK096_002871 [Nowakowskiella sp. JEL0078]
MSLEEDNPFRTPILSFASPSGLNLALAISETTEKDRSLDSILELVKSRVALLTYLKRCHQGKAFYLNTVAITLEDLAIAYENTKMRKRLGLSIGNLLVIPNPLDFARSFLQLMTEFETRRDADGGSAKKMKQMFSRKSRQSDASQSILGDGTNFFESQLSIEVDYLQTVFSLIDVMIASYQKFSQIQESQSTSHYVDNVIKIDEGLQKLLSAMLREMEIIARNRKKQILQDELCLIDQAESNNSNATFSFP